MIKKLLVAVGIGTVGLGMYTKHVYNDLKTNAMMKLYNGEELTEIEAEFLEKHKEFRTVMAQNKEERKNNSKKQAEELNRQNEELQRQNEQNIQQMNDTIAENTQQSIQQMNDMVQQQVQQQAINNTMM